MKRVRFILNAFFLLFVLWPFTSIADDNQCVLLLYHRFSDEGPQSTSTSPEIFEKHLKYLYDKELINEEEYKNQQKKIFDELF